MMNNRRATFYFLFKITLLLLMTTKSFATGNAPTDTGTIVVTLKPLYSLVAHLTDGIQTPNLLIKQTPSSHHYNIRPSQRRLLSNARLIIWFGPQVESYLSKIIQQQENLTSGNTLVISALQAKHLKLLDKRTAQPQDTANQSTDKNRSKPQTVDPHIWLSTHNAAAISKHIAESLISYDPENTESYNKNLQQLLSKIKQTKAFIKTTLNNKPISDEQSSGQQSLEQRPFIAYHDAFQYFENENQLNYIDSISYNEETGPSLKHMRQIRTLIDEKNIQCLVYQPPQPAIVDSLAAQASIKTAALDPLGMNVTDDKNAWFEIMQQLATGFKHCLHR